MATYIKERNNNGPLVAVIVLLIVAAVAIGAYYFFNEDSATQINLPAPTNSEVINIDTPSVPEPVDTNR
jgi:uncharacterized protein HemX